MNSIKEAIKMVVSHFFVITVAVLIFTTLGNTINGIKEYPIYFVWQVVLTGVVGALPSFIFYSKKELTKKQWIVRYVVHFFVIETIILTEGWIFDWYSGIFSALTIAFIVVLVYVVVYAYSYFLKFNTVKRVNSALKDFNKDEED